MKEEGADEVSCPEKTLRLWLKPLLPLQPPTPPTRLEIRAKKEGPSGNTNRFLTHKGRGVNGRTSSGEHLSLLYISSNTVSYTCTYMPPD